MREIIAALAATASLLLAVPAAAQSVPTLSENDFRLLVTLRSPAISPDGRRAVVAVSRVNWDEDKRETELEIVDVASHAARSLTYARKTLSSPRFSPDGTRLAFIADDPAAGDDGHAQVFVMPLDGGDARPVTHAKQDVEGFAWRRDGRAIAYAAADAPPARKGADRFRDSFIFTTEPIVAKSVPSPAHLFVQTLDGGPAKQLTNGAQNVDGSSLSWSPDGSSVAVVVTPNAILDDSFASRVAVVDVATGSMREPTGRNAWEDSPRFSPDGKHLAYLYSNGDSQLNLVTLYVTTPAGGPGTPISASIDRNVDDYAWSSDSKSLIATVHDGTALELYRFSLEGAAAHLTIGANVMPGVPGISTGAVSVDSLQDGLSTNGTLAFVGTGTARPPELYARAPDGTTAKLTNFNAALAGRSFASATRVTFPTTTGITGDGVLYRPPGFAPERTYPLVVFIHGGPTSSSTLAFDFWAQVMAARGWLVLRPNYRGSNNLGLAYQRAVRYDPEEGPGKDIVASIDAVRALGIVDGTRIGVGGWSYGGIMTAWMISKYHFWKAAVSGASVNDWITDYGTADDANADAALFHGSPFVGNNAAEWRRASAVEYVAQVTTPVLILSDVGDNRDPFATSSMYWRALRDNHKDATLRVWPVSGHFPSDPVRTADVFHYWIDFFAAHF